MTPLHEVIVNNKTNINPVWIMRQADLRKNRMNSLKEKENTEYTNLDNIKDEVLKAKKTFQKYKWPVIDVTRKSVEETAASIIKIHEIYSNNVK